MATSLERGDPNLRAVLDNQCHIMTVMMHSNLLASAVSSGRSIEEIERIAQLAVGLGQPVLPAQSPGLAPKAPVVQPVKVAAKPAAVSNGIEPEPNVWDTE
jgi:hypothetical protein